MKADAVLKMLHEKRNTALHSFEPFDLYFKQGFKMPEKYGGVITMDHLKLAKPAPSGQIRMTLRSAKTGRRKRESHKSVGTSRKMIPRTSLKDRREGLQKMDAILKELSTLGLDSELSVHCLVLYPHLASYKNQIEHK